MASTPGAYTAVPPEPQKAGHWTGYYIEIKFDDKYQFSTPGFTWPDTLPFPDCTGKECSGHLLLEAEQPITDDDLNPIFAASKYTKRVKSTEGGSLWAVAAPQDTELKLLHLYGDAGERGVAHGQLLSTDILDFVENDLEEFYRSEIDGLPWADLPSWLADKLRPLLDQAATPVFDGALGWVYEQQQSHVPTRIWDELAVCYRLARAAASLYLRAMPYSLSVCVLHTRVSRKACVPPPRTSTVLATRPRS